MGIPGIAGVAVFTWQYEDAFMSNPKHLEIDTGCPVFVELNGSSDKLKSKIVGYDPQKFVIIATPGGAAANSIDSGQQVVLKYVYEGMVICFKTPVIGTVTAPEPLLFIAYPSDITRQNLRTQKRYACDYNARLNIGQKTISCRLVDISLGGCCCSAANSVMTDTGLQFSPGDSGSVEIELPGGCNWLTVASTVSNAWSTGDQRQVGISFADVDETRKKQIKQLIYHTLPI